MVARSFPLRMVVVAGALAGAALCGSACRHTKQEQGTRPPLMTTPTTTSSAAATSSASQQLAPPPPKVRAPSAAAIRSMEVVMKTIRQAGTMSAALDGTCPTLDELVNRRELEADHASDPWGEPYDLRCTEHDVVVSSAGPDRQLGTADDIVHPPDL